MNRRQLLAAPLLASPALVQAQPAWPNRSVRIIIPFTPSGASDLMMRPVAERLERLLGQSFVIDNRPGGGGAVGVGAESPKTLNPALSSGETMKVSASERIMV